MYLHGKFHVSVKFLICILLVIVCVMSITSTVRMEGTINYQEDKVVILFSPFEIDVPSSLESDNKSLMQYAKNHDGEKILCDVLTVRTWNEKIFFLKKCYTSEGDF